MTGSITVANPLPPFMPLTDITTALTAMTFTDGIHTRTLANSFLCTFRVATDGAGNITQWQITLRQSPYTTGNPQQSIDSTGDPGIPEGATSREPAWRASTCSPIVLTTFGATGSQGTWIGQALAGETIPALDELGLLALMALLAGRGGIVMRR